MALRFLALGTLVVLSSVGVSSAVAPVQRNPLHAISAPGSALLHAFGTRSAQQRASAQTGKLDATLADLSRHLSQVHPTHQLADLHSLSPAARFTQRAPTATPLVLVDAVTRGDPQSLKAALEGLGLEHASVYANDVGGWLPVTAIAAAAARAELVSVRAALPHTRGAVALQGDYVQHSALVRSSYSGITGAGITVGVLSDSFDCYAVYAAPGSTVPVSGNEGYAPNGFTADYATDVSTGALPAGVNVLAEPYTSPPTVAGNCTDYGAPTQAPYTDEGRAMLQVVHAVAPGASLAFYTADDSEADFAAGIEALAAAGAKVIADDVGYFDEPFFQDGLVAEAVDSVEAGGVAYFSAAGNDSNLSYENTAPSFATPGSGTMNGEYLLNFDTTGASNSTSLPVTVPPIPPGDFLAIVVEWDQPYVTGAAGSPGATSSIDLCVTGASAGTSITDNDGNSESCTGPNVVGVDPVQILIIGNPANAAGNTAQQTLDIMVGLSANSAGTISPGRIIVSVEDDGLGSTIDSFGTGSATIQGHPGAAGAAAVGAAFYFDTPACGTSPAQLESFSSEGGAPILFNTAGTRLATPIVRQKPDFVGPDGINTTFLGFTLASDSPPFPKTGLLPTSISECQNNTGYPNFFGTSAAAPHAAGIAALAMQASLAATPATTATPAQIYASLRSSALPMSSTTPNFNSGYGLIQADAAFVVPTLTLGAASIPFGSATTLAWSTLDPTSTSCTASANPATNFTAPTPAASGSITVTPAAAGATVYTFTCTGAAGTSASSSATLFATSGTPPGSPTLTLAATTVAVGKSTTLTWSSANATSCTASGSWGGTLAASGTQTVTPAMVGTETFTLVCANLGGPSAPVSVSLNATAALVTPPAPTLTLGASSIAADTTTSITWSSVGASTCTASGNANANQAGWAGVQAPSSTFTVTPDAVGSFVFSMYCSNAAGNSPTTSVTLTVTASLDTGGGGGGLDELSLLGLAACVVVLRWRVRA